MKLYAFGKIEVDNITKLIQGDTTDEERYDPKSKVVVVEVEMMALVMF